MVKRAENRDSRRHSVGLTRPRPALLLMLALGMLLLGYAGQGLSGEPSWGLTITYVAMVVAALALLAGCATGALRRLRERG